jgi:hypothetical protein
MKKISVKRTVTFMAYKNQGQSVELLSKSDCHYYCEKDALDWLKAQEQFDGEIEVYKVNKAPGKPGEAPEALLIETITLDAANCEIIIK